MQYYAGGGLASEDAREGVFVDKASRKNVLFLVGDDLRPNLGSYREVKMKQPFFFRSEKTSKNRAQRTKTKENVQCGVPGTLYPHHQVNRPLVSSPAMHTPHLDALASTSLQFNKAFVQVAGNHLLSIVYDIC